MLRTLLILFSVLGILQSFPIEDAKIVCGYSSCRNTNLNALNVHIVPHSHDDLGWIKTIEGYYYDQVQYIIDSVIEALSDNPERRYIQVETAFFHKWWNDQNQNKQDEVRKLVNNGQLEFVGGGWSMNDEGTAHYHAIIDQMSLGLIFLNNTFGYCAAPKIGWQIDAFGHSKEMARIFADLGYEALFFARLDWRDKSKRLKTNTPEMLWQGSRSLGNMSNIFTSVLYNHYSPPPSFCFDTKFCYDLPIIDDESSYEYNQKMRIENFADFIRKQAKHYTTNNIIITMGDDFYYQAAHSYYANLDKLIKGFELFPQYYEELPINVFYSTPSCYIKSVNEAAAKRRQVFHIKTDDFFPYASDQNSYWTGYFTSRPTSKHLARQANNFLQVHKQLESVSTIRKYSFFELQTAVGLMQHHDAITGTEQQHVADDYSRIVDLAMLDSEARVNEILTNLLNKDKEHPINFNFQNCLLANISVCPQSQKDNFLVTVYNPLSRLVDYYVRLPVDKLDYDIKGPIGEPLKYQISLSPYTFNLDGRHHAKYELAFLAEKVPGLGLKVYTISTKTPKEYSYQMIEDTSPERFILGNTVNGITVDPKTGLINSLLTNHEAIGVKQELLYYIPSYEEGRNSGAYVFRPAQYDVQSITDFVNTTTFKGELYDELHQNYSTWAQQITRFYKQTGLVEFDWVIGPIPDVSIFGKEVISRVTTNLNSSDSFYTDSNGKEMLKRIRNYRETYNYTNEEPVAGNYYPITTKISIKDGELEMSLLNDRPQGGTSLKTGEIEIMIHRRLTEDDYFGVGEILNEKQYGEGLIVRGSHYLVTKKKDDKSIRNERNLRQERALTPWAFIADISNIKNTINDKIIFEFSGLKESLPDNLQILTLETHPTLEDSLILRLEHIYEVGEHDLLSNNATVNLNNLFTTFKIVDCRETTLGANQWLEEDEVFTWIHGVNLGDAEYGNKLDTVRNERVESRNLDNNAKCVITLKPMQIRTFIIKYVITM